MAAIGRIQEFDSSVEGISSYLEWLQLYLEGNKVKDDERVSVLLTVIGTKVYGVLRSLLAPAKPKDKPYDDLVKALEQHYDPKPLVIGQHFQLSQQPSESISEYTAALCQLSINCEFGTFLDQAL